MAEIFPTPSAARDALIRSGWEVRPAEDLVNNEAGVVAALVAVQTGYGTLGCKPTLVKVVRRPDGLIYLVGRTSGQQVQHWAVADMTAEERKPLLLWIDAEVEVLDPADPRAQHDRVHDGMPADPFGDDPGHAAVATDAIELKTMLDTYIDAGFTRAEAFELILAHYQTELDHAAQHCLVEHQHQYEKGCEE